MPRTPPSSLRRRGPSFRISKLDSGSRATPRVRSVTARVRNDDSQLTYFLFCDLCSRDGPGKEGPVSRACRYRQIHVQRPRPVRKALAGPGSRKRAPWILWSKRGSPQFTHEEHMCVHVCSGRPGLRAPACRLSWNWRVLALQAKTAAFLDATARWSPVRRRTVGVSGPASCRTTSTNLSQACWRGAGTETVPPLSPRIPMPP